MKRGFFLPVGAMTLLLLPFISGAVASLPIDISRPPDYRQLASLSHSWDPMQFRNELGDAIVSTWQPAEQGRRTGSSSQESFARWVDIYQWLDLLASEETEVTKKWLSRHLQLIERQTGQGEGLRITPLEPGTSLNEEGVRPELLDRVVAETAIFGQVLGKLVAQPFTPGAGMLAKRLDPEFVAATVSDPDFLKRWQESRSDMDFAPKVLLNLQSIWQANHADSQEFGSLALAIAVVMDQSAPSFWPHHQVSPAKVPRAEKQPPEVFSEWVQAFRTGKLRKDPRQLGVGDLKFVIDAPLASSEFAAVRNNPTLAYQELQRAFESIVYDKGRLLKNTLSWPWDSYRLSAIKEHGGICVDQAYYAAMTGKVLGIPTIFISGQGRDGGHAWVGYIKWPGQWDFNVARYADQNYAAGEAFDPQTWTQISDHELEFLARPPGNRDSLDASRRDLVVASDFRRRGDVAGEGQALQSALQVYPNSPVIWDAKEDWLTRSGAPVSQLKAHHEAAIAQFSGFTDLKSRHQQALAQIALGSGDKKSAELLSEQIVNENRVGWTRDVRTDLSAAAAWVLVKSRLDGNDVTGALDEFERQLGLQGERGGGDFFYNVIAPYASQLIVTGHQDLALQVLKKSFETLKPAKDSLIDRDLRNFWKKAGGPSSRASGLP